MFAFLKTLLLQGAQLSVQPLFVQTSISYSVCFNRFELFGEAKLRCGCLSNLHMFMWISNCSLLYHQLSPTVFWYVCNSELISLLVLYLGDEFDMNYREKYRAGSWDWWCWLLYVFFSANSWVLFYWLTD